MFSILCMASTFVECTKIVKEWIPYRGRNFYLCNKMFSTMLCNVSLRSQIKLKEHKATPNQYLGQWILQIKKQEREANFFFFFF